MSRRVFVITLALVFAQLTARAEPAMWVIRDADSTIYVIGTMHRKPGAKRSKRPCHCWNEGAGRKWRRAP